MQTSAQGRVCVYRKKMRLLGGRRSRTRRMAWKRMTLRLLVQNFIKGKDCLRLIAGWVELCAEK